MTKFDGILDQLPYAPPFRFVDALTYVDENSAEGTYHFRPEEYFYQGHFVDNPVTPGVILTECMAQIGLVCLGIYLLQQNGEEAHGVVLSESQVIFEKPVYPDEKVHVISRKKYWRMGKLKCEVELFKESSERVCYGTLSGIKAMSNER